MEEREITIKKINNYYVMAIRKTKPFKKENTSKGAQLFFKIEERKNLRSCGSFVMEIDFYVKKTVGKKIYVKLVYYLSTS